MQKLREANPHPYHQTPSLHPLTYLHKTAVDRAETAQGESPSPPLYLLPLPPEFIFTQLVREEIAQGESSPPEPPPPTTPPTYPLKRSPVCAFLPKVLVPRVEVTVEVYKRHRPEFVADSLLWGQDRVTKRPDKKVGT